MAILVPLPFYVSLRINLSNKKRLLWLSLGWQRTCSCAVFVRSRHREGCSPPSQPSGRIRFCAFSGAGRVSLALSLLNRWVAFHRGSHLAPGLLCGRLLALVVCVFHSVCPFHLSSQIYERKIINNILFSYSSRICNGVSLFFFLNASLFIIIIFIPYVYRFF